MKELTNWRLRLTGKIRDLWQGRRSKSTQEHGGITKILNIYFLISAAFIYVAVLNLYDCILDKSGFLDYILFVGLLFLLAIVTMILSKYNKYKWNAFVLLLMGIGTILHNNPGDTSGVAFIMFSVYIFSNLKTNIITASLILLIMAGKNIFMDMGISFTLNLVVKYVFIFALYYILFHPKSKQRRLKIIYCQNLDPETVKIIQYLADGYIYKEIAPLLELTEAAIRKRITRAREVMETKSTTELVIKCHKLDYIRYKIDKAPL